MEQLAEIRAWIYQGKVDEALKALDQLLDAAPSADSSLTSQALASADLKAVAYYLCGNAYRKGSCHCCDFDTAYSLINDVHTCFLHNIFNHVLIHNFLQHVNRIVPQR